VGLTFLAEQTRGPLLVGTFAAADWAIRFYERKGFRLVPPAEKDRLLSTYWSIPSRQKETSVVLMYARWSGPAARYSESRRDFNEERPRR
jgi:hypothetical protein